MKYEGWLKSLLPDQDTFIECNQMRVIFQYSSPHGIHMSSITIAVLGSHW